MAQMLARASRDAEQVSAGLQVFLDNVPRRRSDIDGCIRALLALSAALREIALSFPDYDTINPRLTEDVRVCVASLSCTLREVRAMFSDTANVEYRHAWEDLEHYLAATERGPCLLARLDTYAIFIRSILDSLRGSDRDYVDTETIVQYRRRLERLLPKQQPIERAFEEAFAAGMVFDEPPRWRTPRPPFPPNLRNHSFTATNVSPSWSEETDDGFYPPVPDPPGFDPLSPTESNTTNQTWTSNSSATRVPVLHWATKVFDHKHPQTPLRLPGDPIQFFGRAEGDAIVRRLHAENFITVLRYPFDGAEFYVRLYWRPSDHRARMLCSRKNVAGAVTHFCIPLTALKLTRKGSSLIFWRLDRTTNDMNIWATLTFDYYEPMVLFYCSFVAMKTQDHAGFPEIMQDKYHQLKKTEEQEEFSGEIKDNNFLHALRVYRDKDTGCLRLEARARRGRFIHTPIWTAFVTKAMLSRQWLRVANTKTLQLAELHPYVFCPDYSPPASRSGKFKLQFTSSKDASNFIEIINALNTRQ